MKKSVRLCLSYYPSEYPLFMRWIVGRRAYELLCKASHYKRNPRNSEYMRDVAGQKFGNNYEVIDAGDYSYERVKHASEIVLLWPDASGYGWFGIERKIMAYSKQLNIEITVLNGRRRYFSFNKVTWANYLARRFIERLWLGEIVFSIMFLFVSPFITVWDFIRGRR
jgi:hypothetical protein